MLIQVPLVAVGLVLCANRRDAFNVIFWTLGEDEASLERGFCKNYG